MKHKKHKLINILKKMLFLLKIIINKQEKLKNLKIDTMKAQNLK